MRKPSTEWHRLSNVDRDARTAICTQCGPVRIRIRSGNRSPECLVQRNAGKFRIRRERRREAKPRPPATCEICGTVGPIVRDHDHACCPSGKWCASCFRGWLCRECNLGLGYFRDQPERMLAAIDYLRRA